MITRLKGVRTYDSEKDLVEDLKLLKNEAFEQLFIMYGGALHGIISRIIEPPLVSELILEEAFVKIYASILDYDPCSHKLLIWMTKLARKLAVDKNDSLRILEVSDNATDNNLHHLNSTFLSCLSYPESVILQMIYYQGYTFEEVAWQYKSSPGSIRLVFTNALKLLGKVYKTKPYFSV